MIDRHHLLECILWPNGDGTFRKIVNPYKRLKKLGIYDDWKLVIPIEHGAHSTMHRQFKSGTEYGQEGDKNPMYGRTGEKHPMFGNTREKAPSWKGDKAGPMGMYLRAKKLYKAGQITEEEFQPFRDAVKEYIRMRGSKQKASEN